MDQKVWLITGCSTGFGREIATMLANEGHSVAATARNLEDLRGLNDGGSANVLLLKLDVTSPDEVQDAVQQTIDRFGRIDVLINNAGIGYFGSFEESELERVRRLFEINFWGVVAMTRAVLPTMRKRRSGTIVNITSMGGLVSFPALSFYHASKYAVEGLSESLAMEVNSLGIKVLNVEPGPFRTDWAGRSANEAPQTIEDYAATAWQRNQEMRARNGKQAGDPKRAATLITQSALDPNSPLHLVLGKAAVDLILNKIRSLETVVSRNAELSASADFPSEGKPGQ